VEQDDLMDLGELAGFGDARRQAVAREHEGVA
jgi:hypothetical protein